MNKSRILIGIMGLIVLGFGIQAFVNMDNSEPPEPNQNNNQQSSTPPPATPTPAPNPIPETELASPINRPDERVTKKPFGIFITRANSPVQPEKFSGYHTGTDFEAFESEASSDIDFFAICEGELLQKRTASGYGGFIVQSCIINNDPVTVVYGHIKLSSIDSNVGDNLTKGQKIGILGQPPTDTDGERKHLHLGIHKGTSVNIAGYVQSESQLSNWLDYLNLK